MKTTALSHCAAVPAYHTAAHRSLPARLKQLTLTAAAAFALMTLLPAAPSVNAAAADGTVVAWGDNGAGQTAVPAGLSGVTAIAGGYFHTVALKNDGTVVAWGDNSSGQRTVPASLSGVTAIAAGGHHTAAVKSDGTVVAWGFNGFGQTTVPVGLSGVTAIAGGVYHTVALRSDGTVVAWGYNGFGQTTVPAGLSGVTAIAAGVRHTVALKSDGTVVAWGNNDWGQTTVPAGLSGVTAIAAGNVHTVASRSDGTVVAWGFDGFGLTTPAGLSGVTAIAAGDYHTVALKSDGTVVAWGQSFFGQTTVPAGLSGVVAIAAGRSHTLALVAPADSTPPVLSLPENGVVEATGPSGAVVSFSASATDAVDGPVAVTLSPASGSTFPLGTTTVNASATDAAGNPASGSFTITVRDTTAPVLSVPGNGVVEATGPSGAGVTFAGSASDLVSGAVAVSFSPASGSTFPLGTTTVTASATDAAGNTTTGSFTVTVRDTTAPVITSLTASTAVLWPPNHKMVSVTVSGVATEAVSEVTGRILSVTSNEPDNGLGDGDTAGDIVITSAGTVSLRAERSGKGNGRIYTILFEARDASGNTSTKTVTVSVPKSQGK